jgi:hypothetical protein
MSDHRFHLVKERPSEITWVHDHEHLDPQSHTILFLSKDWEYNWRRIWSIDREMHFDIFVSPEVDHIPWRLLQAFAIRQMGLVFPGCGGRR